MITKKMSFCLLIFSLVLSLVSSLPLAGQDISKPLDKVILAPTGTPAKPYRGNYDFPEKRDFFTYNIPVWEKALASYKGKPDIHYLEIGVFEGRSMVWMLENILTHPTCRLTGLDIFLDYIRDKGEVIKTRFLNNVKKAGGADRLTLIVGYSQVELRKLPLASFDIIYVDGSHAKPDVLEDAVLSWRLLKKGGLMIFDDYPYETNRGKRDEEWPMPAINAFVLINRPNLDIVSCDYQVIIRKREKPQY